MSRANTIAVVSPKGGVGKTTCTFLLGNLLCSHLGMRVVAVDANPDFGNLASLAPGTRRVERSLADLVDDLDGLRTAAELRPYVVAATHRAARDRRARAARRDGGA